MENSVSYPNQPLHDSAGPEVDGRLLIKPSEAAALLSVSERTLWTLSNKCGLPCVRIGRSVRYAPRDLEVWVERHKSAGRASAPNDSSAGNLPLTDNHNSTKDE